MGLDDSQRTRESSCDSRSRSKSPFRPAPLASEDSLSNSHSSGCPLSDHNDDDDWVGFPAGFDHSIPKRDNSATIQSLASTATLTSTGSSHGNSSSSSANPSPRISNDSNNIGHHKSPGRSPRHVAQRSSEKSERSSRKISSMPLTEDDRGKSRNDRRGRSRSAEQRKPQERENLYYQPSKASLHDSNINVPTQKPQRVRSRSNSKGPILRRNSHGDSQSVSQHSLSQHSLSQHSEYFSDGGSSRGTSKRGKSCDPNGGSGGKHGCNGEHKKRASPGAVRNRKKPSSARKISQNKASNAAFHESWPRPEDQERYYQRDQERQLQRDQERHHQRDQERHHQRDQERHQERYHQRDQERHHQRDQERHHQRDSSQKTKQKKRKSKSLTKKKETKGSKEEDDGDYISFLENIATQKSSTPAGKSSNHPGRSFNRSSSARCVSRSRSPASNSGSSIGTGSTHGNDTGGDSDIDSSAEKKGRRNSAPAKAMEAFHKYKKSLNSSDYVESEEKTNEHVAQAPKERVLLDVSELAALEIIRLGKDNSLKLDVFDLVKHLRQQQILP